MPNRILQMLNLRSAKLLLASGAILGTSLASADVIYQQDFENWNNAGAQWSTSTKSTLGGPYSTVLGRFGNDSVTLNVLATRDNNGGFGSPDGNPFNITHDTVDDQQNALPFLDQSGGGGSGGTGESTHDSPTFNLGQAIQDQNANQGPPRFGPGSYSLRFDLMLFDSWDGNDPTWGTDSVSVNINNETKFNEVFLSYTDQYNTWNPSEVPEFNAYDDQWIDRIFRDIEVEFELTQATDLLSIEFIGQISQSINDESWGIDNISLELNSLARTSSPQVPVPGTLVALGGGLGLMSRRKRSR